MAMSLVSLCVLSLFQSNKMLFRNPRLQLALCNNGVLVFLRLANTPWEFRVRYLSLSSRDCCRCPAATTGNRRRIGVCPANRHRLCPFTCTGVPVAARSRRHMLLKRLSSRPSPSKGSSADVGATGINGTTFDTNAPTVAAIPNCCCIGSSVSKCVFHALPLVSDLSVTIRRLVCILARGKHSRWCVEHR